MQVYEITGWKTGVSQSGVNFLQMQDAFQSMLNGYIYRQILQSRMGIRTFSPRLAGETRVLGIFEHTLLDQTKQLLAFDRNFLYKYNLGTGVFDQIPFGGSMAAYPGFNIVSQDGYISGTSYSGVIVATGVAFDRFVFTGEAITPNGNNSGVFFYDGTNVKDFLNVGDNPNYSPPIPPNDVFVKAAYVIFFNERLNFVLPYVAGNPLPQAIFYSGIRDNIGNGDKFNVPGAGVLQVDTYETITGCTILGQVISLNFNRSNYTLEKTQDAFNPYFIRKVPSVLGTNAKFSAVQWDDVVKSLGKTGIIGTDGRQTLRVDNKIPYFTRNEIVGAKFNQTYGGFDRVNNQFLWAYQDYNADETENTQNKVLVGNYEEDTWSINDQRLTVFGQTDLGRELAWDAIDETANEAWLTWDTTDDIWDEIGIEGEMQKTLAGDDMGFIYEINVDNNDYYANISAITQSATATFTISESAFKVGDLVAVFNVEGMVEVNNYDPIDFESNINFIPYEVIFATPTQIRLNVDTTDMDPYVPFQLVGAVTKVIEFQATTIPFNPFRSEGRRCYISHVEFLMVNNGASIKVDILPDEDTFPYKSNIIIFPTMLETDTEWVSMSVNQEANFHTFVIKNNVPFTQVRIKSIRIHCQPGGFTNG